MWPIQTFSYGNAAADGAALNNVTGGMGRVVGEAWASSGLLGARRLLSTCPDVRTIAHVLLQRALMRYVLDLDITENDRAVHNNPRSSSGAKSR